MVGSVFNPRPRSVHQVADYVFKKLGSELLEINVTESQLLDRISDAIVYFQEHHVDGTKEGYFKTMIAPSTIVVNASVEDIIVLDDTISNDNFSATVIGISDDFLTLSLKNVIGTITTTETIEVGLDVFTIATYTPGPAELGYITIPENVESIVQVLELPTSQESFGAAQQYSSDRSDLSYYDNVFHYKGSGLGISFYMQQMRQETLAWLTQLNPWADFNRYVNRAYVNSYDYNANICNWLVFRVMVSVDPEDFPEMYGDTWFLDYCTELIRKQWGENLSKYKDVVLLNGVTVNGPEMVDQAKEALKELRDEMDARYRIPDDFFMA